MIWVLCGCYHRVGRKARTWKIGVKVRVEVPLRFELRSLDSESRVLTITPWDLLDTCCGPALSKGWGIARGSTNQRAATMTQHTTHLPPRCTTCNAFFLSWHSGALSPDILTLSTGNTAGKTCPLPCLPVIPHAWCTATAIWTSLTSFHSN